MNHPIENLADAIRYECEARGDADYTIPEIVDAVLADHPEAVAEATRRSQRTIVTRAAKQHIAPAASQQPTLPGFDALPLRIALPTEGGGYVYRATRRATLEDLAAHKSLLDANITDAITRRDQFEDELDKVRALFAHYGVDRICDLPTEAMP